MGREKVHQIPKGLSATQRGILILHCPFSKEACDTTKVNKQKRRALCSCSRCGKQCNIY
jgi:hypothetical protein